MILVGQTYVNETGSFIDIPNRLTQSWQPGERIRIRSVCTNPVGYIVDNLDYCGVHENLYTSFVDERTLALFTLKEENK